MKRRSASEPATIDLVLEALRIAHARGLHFELSGIHAGDVASWIEAFELVRSVRTLIDSDVSWEMIGGDHEDPPARDVIVRTFDVAGMQTGYMRLEGADGFGALFKAAAYVRRLK